MIIKHPELVISAEDPFEHDLLNRKENVFSLAGIISSLPSPFVISLNGEYGTGKTTYIKQLKQVLENQKYKCLYFDAWANDYSQDPFISLVGEFKANFPDQNFEKLRKSASKIASKIFKNVLPLVIKVATHGVLDTHNLGGLSENLGEISENVTESLIESYEKEKVHINVFKQDLGNFVQEVSSDGLIIFIDELDRCKPSYAIELLERVKHLFNIPNIIFILSMNREQIGHSLGCVYGAGINTDEYLRKFIDYEISLPETSKEAFVGALFKKHDLHVFFESRKNYIQLSQDAKFLEETFSFLARTFNLTLRSIEKCFIQFVIVLKMTKEKDWLHADVLALLVVLKTKEDALYRAFLNGSINPEHVFRLLNKKASSEDQFFKQRNYVLFELAFLASTVDSWGDLYKKYYEAKQQSYLSGITDDLTLSDKEILGLIKNHRFDTYDLPYQALARLTKKLELLDSFKFEN